MKAYMRNSADAGSVRDARDWDDRGAKVFAGEGRKSVFTVETLPSSYFNLVDRRKLEALLMSRALLAEVRKSTALTASSLA